MKKITIKIIELKDITHFLYWNIYRVIKFYFSRPKYKIEDSFIVWGKRDFIYNIKRDWEYLTWSYHTMISGIWYTEGLVDFYKEEEKQKECLVRLKKRGNRGKRK